MKAVWILGLALVLSGCDVNPVERNNAGNALYLAGEHEAAVLAYQAAQVAAPDEPAPYYNVGGALSEDGELEQAVLALQQALKSADEDLSAKAYHNLGNVYYQMARYDDAVLAYREALLLRPDDEDTRHNYELALGRVPTATPPPDEQRSQPEMDESDPEATPTNNPGMNDGPSPTPPPEQGPPDFTPTPLGGAGQAYGEEPSTPVPLLHGPLSLEEAERRLDAVQQNQQTLQEYLEERATPSVINENDW